MFDKRLDPNSPLQPVLYNLTIAPDITQRALYIYPYRIPIKRQNPSQILVCIYTCTISVGS